MHPLKTTALCLTLCLFGSTPGDISAAGHFPDHAITGNNMVVLILASINPTIDGRPLNKGDEIAAFTPEGHCVGVTEWKGAGKNIALSVWGKSLLHPQIDGLDGLRVGDSIQYRIWDSTNQVEAMATATYTTTGVRNLRGGIDLPTSGGTYVIDGISFLASLTGISSPVAPIRLLFPRISGVVAAGSVAFTWTRGSSGIDRYIIEAAGDSALSTVIFADTLADTADHCDIPLTRGASYWWRVKGRTGENWSECSAPREFRVAP
jgi:hypothetical protein